MAEETQKSSRMGSFEDIENRIKVAENLDDIKEILLLLLYFGQE